MPDSQLPLAQRRLAAILRDESYGPKLVRLNRNDERTVLDLIYENKGKEAREAIIRLDEDRRMHRTVRANVSRYTGLPKRQRQTQWKDVKKRVKNHENEFWRLYKAATR